MLYGRGAGRSSASSGCSDLPVRERATRSSCVAIPGVGKTALLRHAVERADSMLVLRATGYESEAQLEFSGLVEVCRPLLGSLDALPPVQAAALSSALGASPRRRRTTGSRLPLRRSAWIAGAAEEMPALVLVRRCALARRRRHGTRCSSPPAGSPPIRWHSSSSRPVPKVSRGSRPRGVRRSPVMTASCRDARRVVRRRAGRSARCSEPLLEATAGNPPA